MSIAELFVEGGDNPHADCLPSPHPACSLRHSGNLLTAGRCSEEKTVRLSTFPRRLINSAGAAEGKRGREERKQGHVTSADTRRASESAPLLRPLPPLPFLALLGDVLRLGTLRKPNKQQVIRKGGTERESMELGKIHRRTSSTKNHSGLGNTKFHRTFAYSFLKK